VLTSSSRSMFCARGGDQCLDVNLRRSYLGGESGSALDMSDNMTYPAVVSDLTSKSRIWVRVTGLRHLNLRSPLAFLHRWLGCMIQEPCCLDFEVLLSR
jgi:hypothetical protein